MGASFWRSTRVEGLLVQIRVVGLNIMMQNYAHSCGPTNAFSATMLKIINLFKENNNLSPERQTC